MSMVVTRNYLLILFFIALISVGISFYPWYALAGACTLMFSLYLIKTRKTEMPRILSIITIVFLVCFNILQKSISQYILGGFIGVYVLFFLLNKDYRTKNKGKGQLFFIAWLIYAFIQKTWIETSDSTSLYFKVILFGVVAILFMGRLITSKKHLGDLYKWWGFGLLSTILVGLWEVTTNHHFSSSGAAGSYYNLQHAATVGFFNPNDYSFFLVVSLPIIFYWIKKKALYRFIGIFMLISSFYITNQNGARFIEIIYVAAVVLFLIRLLRKRKILLTYLFVSVALIGVFNFNTIYESLASSVLPNSNDESVYIRKLLLENGWSIFKTHPFGIGAGNITSYMAENGLGVNGITVVHNFWLEILIEFGIFVFLGFFIFYVSSLYRMYKAVKHMESIRNLVRPLLWSSVIFIPACIESSSIFVFNITWFFFGTMICVVNVIKNENKVNVNHLPQTLSNTVLDAS